MRNGGALANLVVKLAERPFDSAMFRGSMHVELAGAACCLPRRWLGSCIRCDKGVRKGIGNSDLPEGLLDLVCDAKAGVRSEDCRLSRDDVTY